MSANVRPIGSHRCIAVLKRKKRRKKYPGLILQLFGVPLESSIGGAGGRSLLRGPWDSGVGYFLPNNHRWGVRGVVGDGIVSRCPVDWMW
jgi:hypothetical protein